VWGPGGPLFWPAFVSLAPWFLYGPGAIYTPIYIYIHTCTIQ
jgi:hypothetical protein